MKTITRAKPLHFSPVTAGVMFGLLAAASSGASGCGKTGASTSTGVLGSVQSIAFAKRANFAGPNGTNPVVSDGSGQVIDYLRYVPGGGVYTLSPPRPDGTLVNLTADYPTADINGMDLSFDGSQVVFSMMTSSSDNYHIYVADIAAGADGKHNVHQLTFGARDDVMPIWVPGARIAFSTNQPYTPMGTRADEYEHATVVSQIATISSDSGDADRRVCAQNLSHTVNLFMRSDGAIGYSRWEHLGNVNDVKIFKVNPDCTQMLAVAGQHGNPVNSLTQVREISPNVMLAVASPRNRTLQAGALYQINAGSAADPTIGDEENVTFTNLSPAVPSDSSASPAGRYRSPNVLPDGRFIASWADGAINDQNETDEVPANWGLYLYDPASQTNQLIYDDPMTAELYIAPVVARTEPPVVYDVKRVDPSLPGVIGSIDVTQTSLTDTVDGAEFSMQTLGVALQSAVAVRVIEGFSSEIGSMPMFGLTMHEGAAILGEAPIYGDGSWLAQVPSYIPMHLQPIDKFGMAIRSQGLWIQTNPGEQRTCGGCHERRTSTVTPRLGSGLTLAQQKGPVSFVKPIDQRSEYAWDKVVQPILDAKCVSCHGPTSTLAQKTYTVVATADDGTQTKYVIPWLDLTGTAMNAAYDKGTYQFSRSYVSLYYPAQLSMGMAEGLTVIGDLPPNWMVPENAGDSHTGARGSVMIQTLNPVAPDGTLAWPGQPQHDVANGVALTAEEMGILIRSADLGGQWTSRQNVKTSSCWESAQADLGTCGNGGAGTVYP